MLALLSYSYLCFELYILFGLVNLGEMTATCAGYENILIDYL